MARSFRLRPFFAVLLGSLVLLLVAADARAQTGTITGTVTNQATGLPFAINDHNVVIYNTAGQQVMAVSPNGSGNYAATGLTAGTYYARTRRLAVSGNFVDELWNNQICGYSCDVTAGTAIVVMPGATVSNINFALGPGAQISGTITNAVTQQAVPNVRVDLYSPSGVLLTFKLADATGAYTFQGLASGSYLALTNVSGGINFLNELYDNLPCPAGCVVTAGTPISATIPSTTSNVNFSLSPAGAISGQVSGGGNPLSGVGVRVHNRFGQFVKSSSTDGSGNYTVTGLPTGSYVLRTQVVTQNFQDEIYNDLPCPPFNCFVTTGTPVTVNAGVTTSGINFALPAGGSVAGIVTASAGGAPLQSAFVTAISSDGTFSKSAASGADGSYTVGGLAPGSYYVKATGPSGQNFLEEFHNNVTCWGCQTAGTPVAVTSGNTTLNVNFALAAGGSINGVVSGPGGPVAGVGVQALSGPGVRSATTNASGVYSIVGLATGPYTVRTFAPNSVNLVDEVYSNIQIPCQSCGTPTAVQVSQGMASNNVDFTLAAGGSVQGVVTSEATGQPVSGVTVEVVNADGFARPVTTGVDGSYSANGLVTGNWFVRARPATSQNLVPEIYDNKTCTSTGCTTTSGTPVPVSTGSTVTGINMSLAPGGTVQGVVADEAGIPLGGAFLEVYTANRSVSVVGQTDNAGTYTVAGLPAGEYLVHTLVSGTLNYIDELYDDIDCMRCLGVPGTPIPVQINAVVTGINFELEPGGIIVGTVTGGGAPLAGVNVTAYTSAGSQAASAITNGAGKYRISGVKPGQYFVRTAVTSAQNFVNELYDNKPCLACVVTSGNAISVTLDSETTADFALSAGGTISGTVTFATGGAPARGVTIAVYETITGLHIKSAASSDTGTYTIQGLPAGSYVLRTFNTQNLVDEIYNDIPCLGTCAVTSGSAVNVAVGNTTSNVNFALTAGGSITGTVTENGTAAPLAGVFIRAFNNAGALVTTAATVGSGEYTLPNLPAGTYYLRTENASGHIDERYNNQVCVPSCTGTITSGTAVVVTAGNTAAGRNFGLARGGRIGGTVTASAGGAPIGGVTVKIFDVNGALATSAVTDAAGTYLTGIGLPTGTYYARTFNALGFRDERYNDLIVCFPTCVVTSGTAIAVTAPSTTNNINFALAAAGAGELILNGSFTNGMANWSLFATPDMSYVVSQVTSGVFEYYRVPPPPGTTNQAVLIQQTNAALAANTALLAQFDLGNSSSVRKRISVLVHDNDFSDLHVCTFWLAPNTPLARYGMRTRTNEAWTNTTISFYAASAGSAGGFNQIDQVSLQTVAQPSQPVDCVDPTVPGATAGADGPNLLVNGDFASGALAPGWTTFGQVQTNVTGGVLQFHKLAGAPAGVVLQPIGQPIGVNEIVTATFSLGNSSAARQRVTVILHDNNFGDLVACTFWLNAGQALSSYSMRTFATQAWTNATFSIYPATLGNHQWIRLDNVSFRRTPSAVITGADCIEPGGTADERETTTTARRPAGTAPSVPVDAGAHSPSVDAGVIAAPENVYVAEGALWLADGFTPAPDGFVARADASRAATLTRLEPLDVASGAARLTFRSRFRASQSRAVVEISTDGEGWSTILVVTASDNWVPVDVDLSGYAGEPIRIRLLLESTGEPGSVDEVWEIEDLATAPEAVAARAERPAHQPAVDQRATGPAGTIRSTSSAKR